MSRLMLLTLALVLVPAVASADSVFPLRTDLPDLLALDSQAPDRCLAAAEGSKASKPGFGDPAGDGLLWCSASDCQTCNNNGYQCCSFKTSCDCRPWSESCSAEEELEGS